MNVEETIREVLRERAADPVDLLRFTEGVRVKARRARRRRRAAAVLAPVTAAGLAAAWFVAPRPADGPLPPTGTQRPDLVRLDEPQTPLPLPYEPELPDSLLVASTTVGTGTAGRVWYRTNGDGRSEILRVGLDYSTKRLGLGGKAFRSLSINGHRAEAGKGAGCTIAWSPAPGQYLRLAAAISENDDTCESTARLARGVKPSRVTLTPIVRFGWLPPGYAFRSFTATGRGSSHCTTDTVVSGPGQDLIVGVGPSPWSSGASRRGVTLSVSETLSVNVTQPVDLSAATGSPGGSGGNELDLPTLRRVADHLTLTGVPFCSH